MLDEATVDPDPTSTRGDQPAGSVAAAGASHESRDDQESRDDHESRDDQESRDDHESRDDQESRDDHESRDDTVRAPSAPLDTGPAREWAAADRALVVARPDEMPEGVTHLSVLRTFCFADLSGFTAYTRARGPHEAAAILGEFRRVTRTVSVKRGVRIAKWLGDGTMLVSTDTGAAIALGAHLIHHFSTRGVQMRVGAATGEALLFEGDDYIGEAVNLAAKLCAVAPAGEMYAVVDEQQVPEWVTCLGDITVHIDGIGRIDGVHRLQPAISDGS